ncbi:MAG: FlxA-like family protein [Butyrivibrio sp.]|nr:FlxA-like family protein [Muribaculum sp.]MCM1553457.1 FlxA-like family protein [Butyrivibrio sp.]
MTINGINGANTQMGQMGMNQAADSYSRSLQNQISNAQKQLQELSSNEDMTLEDKMKKRQEIQQQISDLNVQLRQHQMEQRRAAMNNSAKDSSMDDLLGGTRSRKAGNKGSGISQASMTAIISADNSMKLAQTQGSVATRMEGRAGVLESEIKLDGARGDNTQKKEEELADVKQKAQAAATSQISTLADASRTMEKAAQEDSKAEKADDRTEKADDKTKKADIKTPKTDGKTKKADIKTQKADDKDTKTAGVNEKDAFQENGTDENVSDADAQKETLSGSEGVNTQSDISVSEGAAAVTATPQPTAYVSVDIRL